MIILPMCYTLCMKNNKLILIASCLLLTSCNSYEKISAAIEGNQVTYRNTYDVSEVTFHKNEQGLTKDKETDIKNYFLNYGSHLSNATDYIFLYKGVLNGRNFKIDISYDTNLENNPYFLAATYYLDDSSTLPNSYYYFSTYFNLTDFKKDSYTISYCYDYLDKNKEEQYTYLDITYSDIAFATSPLISKATYSIATSSTIPDQEKKKEEDLALDALEPIRASSCYLEKLLTTISSDYHLW